MSAVRGPRIALPGAPLVDQDRCTGCGLCVKPGHCFAITLLEGKAVVDAARCYGCAICIALCPPKALSFAAQRGA